MRDYNNYNMLGINIHSNCLFCLAPSAPPTPVSASDVTSFSITVQWGPVDCIHRNGEITGYLVQYGVEGSGSTQTVIVSGGGNPEVIISGLQSTTAYLIEVAAVNSAGTGVYSRPTNVLSEGQKKSMKMLMKNILVQ